MLHDRLKQIGGSCDIRVYVVCDVVHTLANARLGGKVKHECNVLKGLPQILRIAHVSADAFNSWAQARWEPSRLSMDLGIEGIQHPDAVARASESLCRM